MVSLPLSDKETLLTAFLKVEDMTRSRDFYACVLGGKVTRDGEPTTVKLHDIWIIINGADSRTNGKPAATGNGAWKPYTSACTKDGWGATINVRVSDLQQEYEAITARGGEFLTPLIDLGQELQCYIRDPDGHLIGFSQMTAPAKPTQ